jgi:hypothetical protein
MPETRAKTATIKTIFMSLFSLDTRAATPGKSWMFRALPKPYLFEICDVLKTAFTGREHLISLSALGYGDAERA